MIRSASDLRDPFPSLVDVLANPLFEDLVWHTLEDEELTSDFFRSMFLQHLPHIIDEWRCVKTQELVEIMRKSRPNASPADLHLATSVFECTGCLDATNPRSNAVRMIYPQMFYHSCCLWHRQPVKSRSDERIKAYRPRLSSRFTAGPWSSQSITWSEIGSQNAKKIVETCSLDPDTTTIKDLDFVNPLIECCEQHSVRIFMRWPFAVGIV